MFFLVVSWNCWQRHIIPWQSSKGSRLWSYHRFASCFLSSPNIGRIVETILNYIQHCTSRTYASLCFASFIGLRDRHRFCILAISSFYLGRIISNCIVLNCYSSREFKWWTWCFSTVLLTFVYIDRSWQMKWTLDMRIWAISK